MTRLDREPLAPPFDHRKLDSMLEAAGVDVALASSRHSCRYLLGGYEFHMFPEGAEAIGLTRYLPIVGYLPRRLGEAFYIGNTMERDVLRETPPWMEDVSCCSWTLEDTVGSVVSQLAERALQDGRIGVELSSLPAAALLILQRDLPSARFVDVTHELEVLRMVKQPYELTLMRSAASRIEAAMIAAAAIIVDGDSTREIASKLTKEATARGLVLDHCFVSAGLDQSRVPSRTQWHSGSSLSIDFGGRVGGYVGDLARMFCRGLPTALQAAALNRVVAVQSAALQAVAPGVRGCDVIDAATMAIDALAAQDSLSFLAHGLGLVNHEAPWLVGDAPWNYPAEHSATPLEAGTVISIETTLTGEDVGFIKVEDMVLVTTTGFDELTPGQREWIQLDAAQAGADTNQHETQLRDAGVVR